jgi:hypothetical protein
MLRLSRACPAANWVGSHDGGALLDDCDSDALAIVYLLFLMYLDDTEYKHLKGALDLRNGCGHPTGYQPDPVRLQAYYADIMQLVLLNPKFT